MRVLEDEGESAEPMKRQGGGKRQVRIKEGGVESVEPMEMLVAYETQCVKHCKA